MSQDSTPPVRILQKGPIVDVARDDPHGSGRRTGDSREGTMQGEIELAGRP